MRVFSHATGTWERREIAQNAQNALMVGTPDPDILWGQSEAHHNYLVRGEDQSSVIYPINPKTGKSMRVTKPKYVMIFRHIDTDVLVEFSKYKNMGRWYWRDSRDAKPTNRDEIVASVSRMLKLERTAASELLARYLGG